ncbi:semaphorin-7A [Engystomops pustulosus]|uniref:semaphorin-7A n=1 Tax=Engystomops pustulosus TaxID=76066 RepID=UPI003AFA6A7C
MELHTAVLLSVLVAGSLAGKCMDPRLTHPVKGKWSFPLPQEEENAVFYRLNYSLYIGGEEILHHFDFEDIKNYKNYTIKADTYRCEGKPHCKNYVTFVGQLSGKLTVCGTNAHNRAGCWAMNGKNFSKLTSSWTAQMAPQTPVTNHNILITGNQVYSTLPPRTNNGRSTMKILFRKISGHDPLLYTGDKLMRDPEFVKSLVVEKEDKILSKIYLFFTEDNTETRTLEKRLPMVAQLCKEEQGSEKANTRYEFSTALKSRMICGNQLTGQYYPQLQDIYFLQGKTGNVIYGLFKNSWNHSAVCSYEVENIELLFNTSSLWGSSNTKLAIRPGTCLSSYTPEETSDEASKNPELNEWLWPSSKKTVFHNQEHYSKIVVDEITGLNDMIYRVLLLATDNGIVHKVVELEDGAFNALKIMPFKQNGKLLFMDLDPNTHILYMGTTREIARLPLDDCAAYNVSCTYCIQSRDPFCGWIGGKCESVLKHSRSMIQQNLEQNATCEYEKESSIMFLKSFRDSSTHKDMHATQYFLTCPTMSKHASYFWKNGDTEMEKCDPSDDICKLIINKVTSPGEYKCMAMEMETEHTVLQYKILESKNSAKVIECVWLLVLTIQLLILM